MTIRILLYIHTSWAMNSFAKKAIWLRCNQWCWALSLRNFRLELLMLYYELSRFLQVQFTVLTKEFQGTAWAFNLFCQLTLQFCWMTETFFNMKLLCISCIKNVRKVHLQEYELEKVCVVSIRPKIMGWHGMTNWQKLVGTTSRQNTRTRK